MTQFSGAMAQRGVSPFFSSDDISIVIEFHELFYYYIYILLQVRQGRMMLRQRLLHTLSLFLGCFLARKGFISGPSIMLANGWELVLKLNAGRDIMNQR